MRPSISEGGGDASNSSQWELVNETSARHGLGILFKDLRLRSYPLSRTHAKHHTV